MVVSTIVISIFQCLATSGNTCTACVFCLNNRRREKKDLVDRLSKLISTLSEIASSKKGIDRLLTNSVSLEKTEEYPNMEKNISDILTKCTVFIDKYTMIIGNQASSTTETLTTGNQQASSTTEPDPLSAMIVELKKLESSMPGELEKMKWKRHPLKNWKLAECSRDIAKHVQLAFGVRERLKKEYMTTERNKLNLEKLNDANDLSVFDEHAKKVADRLLREEKKTIIGIYGPVGVGKTTVLKKLQNRLIEDRSRFQHVIWINYPVDMESEEKILQNLQVEIMEQLFIHHEATMSIIVNANKISAFLHDKKYLLLMDQVSCHVDLGKVGLGDGHNGMNVVIASSDEKLIRTMTDEEFQIQELEEDHAWTLFEKVCGKIDDGNKATAERIIKCCGGIPIYINQIATYLRDKNDESSWIDAVQILQSEPKSCKLLGLAGLDRIYEKIYETLADASVQKCLLYGALFPIQHSIYRDYLVECWIAEGFIVEPDERLRSRRNRGQTILNNLTGKYLMQWCSGKKYVKMQPNFRRVALELDCPDDERKKFIIWVPSEVQAPNRKYHTAGTRMSMIGSEKELPEIPEGCDIYTLLLQKKANLEHLEHRFFDHMPKLQVLDLYKTDIVALPESIEVLISLKGLYLNGCTSLEKLPFQAANLVMLEFLDIRKTKLSSLPEEIGSMVALRCLRASLSMKNSHPNSKGKEVEEPMPLVPPNIINKLKKLEELILDSDQVNDQCWANMAERLALELASLQYLTTLVFNFPNVSSLDKFVDQSKSMHKVTDLSPNTFRSFKIFIGCQKARHTYASEFSEVQAHRWLRHSEGKEFSPGCKELLKQASAFEIIGHDGVETLSQFDLHSVKVCVVECCNSLKSIVGRTLTNEEIILPKFEKLYLYDLQLLECIWDAPDCSQSFSNLTTITINGCHKLTKILNPASAHAFKSLECLKVENCSAISEIVETECLEVENFSEISEIVTAQDQTDLSGILKRLRTIELSNLPELQSICKNTSIRWDSLNSVSITRCSKLINLSLSSTNVPRLASIYGEQSWWDHVDFTGLPFKPFKEASSVPRTLREDGASTSGTVDANRKEQMIEHDNSIELPAAVLPNLGALTNGLVEAHHEEEIISRNNTSVDPPAPSHVSLEQSSQTAILSA